VNPLVGSRWRVPETGTVLTITRSDSERIEWETSADNRGAIPASWWRDGEGYEPVNSGSPDSEK
jgi:hypothetical protein